MGEALLTRRGSSEGELTVPNGILSNYYSSSGAIEKNAFVEFDEYPYSVKPAEDSAFATQIEALSESIGIVVYSPANASGYYDMKARVLDISKSSAVMRGEQTLLPGKASNSYFPMALKKIDDSRALLIYKGPVSTAQNVSSAMMAAVLTVTTTGITMGTPVTIESSKQYLDTQIAVVEISIGKFFIGYCVTNEIRSVVCTVSETVISFGSKKKLCDSTSFPFPVSATLLANGKIVCCYLKDDNYPYYSICTVSGMTISCTAEARINNSYNVFKGICVVEVSDNNIIVFLTYSGSSRQLEYFVGTFSGADISWGKLTAFTYYTCQCGVAAIKTGQNEASLFVPIIDVASQGFCQLVVSVTPSDRSASLLRIKRLSTDEFIYSDPSYVCVSSTPQDSQLIIYLTKYPQYSVKGIPHIFMNSGEATVHKSTQRIDGITKSNIKAGGAGDIWVLIEED